MARADSRTPFPGILVAALAAWLWSGCQSHPCREPRAPELDQTSGPQQPPPMPAVKSNLDPSNPSTASVRVRIFKADGSRQCEKKNGVTLEAMERELAGIPVLSKDKRMDGFMHIQVCGSPTGMINLFEIDQTNLKQAEERGFRRWEGE